MPAGPIPPPKVLHPWKPAPGRTSLWGSTQQLFPILRGSTWVAPKPVNPVAKAISGWQSQQAALGKMVVVSGPHVTGPNQPVLLPRGNPGAGIYHPPGGLRPKPKPAPKPAPKPKPPPAPPVVTRTTITKAITTLTTVTRKGQAATGGPWYPPAPAAVLIAQPAATTTGSGMSTTTMLLIGGAAAGGGYLLWRQRKGKKS